MRSLENAEFSATNTVSTRRPSRQPPIFAAIAILIGYAIALGLRLNLFATENGASGLEASYHVLWTMTAMRESPITSYWLLPTVTLHPNLADPIPWGATVATKAGSYVYTSFPPLGFLIPRLFFSITKIPMSIFTLSVFNTLLGLLAALGLACVVTDIIEYQRRSHATAMVGNAGRDWPIFAITAISFLFLNESLQSFGIVFWPHSISTVVLTWACFCLARILTGGGGPSARWALLGLCILYPMLEWTGFVFNAGVAAVLVLDASHRQGRAITRRTLVAAARSGIGGLPTWIALSTVCVGVLTVLHYALAVGFTNVAAAYAKRAIARSGVKAFSVFHLLPAYWESFGMLLPLGILAAVGLFVWYRRVIHWPIAALLFAASFPVTENLLLGQHAMEFSFDRLKVAVPLFLFIAVFLGTLAPVRRRWLAVAMIVAILPGNWLTFAQNNREHAGWAAVTAANRGLVGGLAGRPELACGVFGSNSSVRGYLNLLFHHDIREDTTAPDLARIAQADGACATIFIETEQYATDLPHVRAVTIATPDGKPVVAVTAPPG